MTNIEYKNDGKYPIFYNNVKDKNVLVIYDINTKPYALDIINKLEKQGIKTQQTYFEDIELVPDENAWNRVINDSKKCDYILAVGSGTLNDIAKYASTVNNIPCGVLATACSMDGYLSKGSAIIENEFKVTKTVHMPSDMLVDLEILSNAPKLMTAAGFGDIIGKYTCLTDWKLSNIINNEPICQEAYKLMEDALLLCVSNLEQLVTYKENAISTLIDALITAGTSMAICGNSRPASGSEHHMSHFLEMDFIKKQERIPPHGIKVAIGAMISIDMYNYLKDNKIKFENCDKVYELASNLPSSRQIREMLTKMGCPTRYRDINVSKNTIVEMINNAYKVRDRFTIMTLYHNLGLLETIAPIIANKYY